MLQGCFDILESSLQFLVFLLPVSQFDICLKCKPFRLGQPLAYHGEK